MNSNTKNYNASLNKLMNTLNNMNIECINNSKNSIEIFFNESQKELVLNLLSQISTNKNGFIFKTRKIGDKKIKSVQVTFFRNTDLNCKFLNDLLNNQIHSNNLNIFNKLDIILESFPYDNITLSIHKNMDLKEDYLVTFNQTMTKEQIDSDKNIVLNNKELNSRIIHTIYSKNNDDSYNVTYGLIYNDERDLNNLLTLKNNNTSNNEIKKTSKLIRTI